MNSMVVFGTVSSTSDLARWRFLGYELKNINTVEYKYTTGCRPRRVHTKYAYEKRTQGQMCPLPQFKGTVSRDIKYSIIFINPLLLVSLEVLYDDLIFRGVIQP
jgi:hypothetical protein